MNRIRQAIEDATIGRGARKGQLKSACPHMGTDAAAAWQAFASVLYPHKLSVMHLMAMDADVRENVYEPIRNHLISAHERV